jgi:hypothetical protein
MLLEPASNSSPDYFGAFHSFIGQSVMLVIALIGAVRWVLSEWDEFADKREARRLRKSVNPQRGDSTQCSTLTEFKKAPRISKGKTRVKSQGSFW